jgi:hypothetical protein
MNYNFIAALVILILVIIPVVVIYSLTLQWIHKLEEIKCVCSNDYKRDVIKYYLYIYLATLAFTALLAITSVFVDISKNNVFKFLKPFMNIFRVLMSIFSFVTVIMSVIYISNLKAIDCKCSEDIRREIYYIWSILSLVITGIVIILSIISITWLYFMIYK